MDDGRHPDLRRNSVYAHGGQSPCAHSVSSVTPCENKTCPLGLSHLCITRPPLIYIPSIINTKGLLRVVRSKPLGIMK